MATASKDVSSQEVHLSSKTTRRVRRPFSCSFCGNLRYFDTHDSYRKHCRRHNKIYRKPIRDGLTCRENFNLTSLNFDDIFSDELTDIDVYTLMNEIMDGSRAVAETFSCLVCDESFADQETLKEHEEEMHNGPKSHACRRCNKRFHFNSQLRYHQQKCHRAGEFKCGICHASFVTKGSLVRHQARKVKCTKIMDGGSADVAEMVCFVCNESFTDKANLEKHEEEMHNGVKLHACRRCGMRFQSHSQLRYHHEKVHRAGADDGFKCVVCHATFVTKGKLARHENQHRDYKKYKCEHCEKSFSSKQYFEAHVKVLEAGGERPFKCAMCSASFIILKHLKGHEKIHTDTQLIYPCDQCPVTFPTKKRQQQHIRRHLNYKKFACSHCEKSFSDLKVLAAHKQDSHQGPQMIQCRKCDVCFQSNGQLRYHDEKCHRMSTFKCDICRANFATKGSMLRHKKQHEDYKKFRCKYCDKTFSNKKYFEAHEKLHETGGERPFKCALCTSSFIIENHLKQHEKIHTGTRLYQCDQCPAAFPTNARLTRHIRGHLDYKKFKCTHCQKLFSDSKYLAAHEKLHTSDDNDKVLMADSDKNRDQEKRQEYHCKHCSKTFYSKQYLVAHKVSHSGERPFKCDICDCAYIIRSHLTAHMKVHNTDTYFYCEVCGKSFPTNARLKRHQKSHTNLKTLVCHICRQSVDGYKKTVPFICECCEKDPNNCSEDENQSVNHLSGSNLDCKCGEKFRSKIALRVHVQENHKHSRDCGVMCNECKCEFRSKQKLVKHAKKIHKLHLCKFCLEAFKDVQSLCKHENEHEKSEQKCPKCEQVLKLMLLLGVHLRDEHEVQEPFICVICGGGFVRKLDGQDHIKESHPGQPVSRTIIRMPHKKPDTNSHMSDDNQNTLDVSLNLDLKSAASKLGAKSEQNVNSKDDEASDDDQEDNGFAHFAPLNANLTNSSMESIIEGFLDVRNSIGTTQVMEKVLADSKSKQVAVGDEGTHPVTKHLDNLGQDDVQDEQGSYECKECGMSFMHKSSWQLHQQFLHCDNKEEVQEHA